MSGALTILSSAPLRDLPDVSLEIFGGDTSSLRSRSSIEALGVRGVFVGVLKYSKTCLKGLKVEPGDESVCTYTMLNYDFKGEERGIVKAWRKAKRFGLVSENGVVLVIATIIHSVDGPMLRIAVRPLAPSL